MSQQYYINPADKVSNAMDEQTAREKAEALKEEFGIQEIGDFLGDPCFLRDGYFAVTRVDGSEATLRVLAKTNPNVGDGCDTVQALYADANTRGLDNPLVHVYKASYDAILMQDLRHPDTGEIGVLYDSFDQTKDRKKLQESLDAVIGVAADLVTRVHQMDVRLDSLQDVYPASGWYAAIGNISKLDDEHSEPFKDIFSQAASDLQQAQSMLISEERLLVGNTHPGAFVSFGDEDCTIAMVGVEAVRGHRANDFRNLFLQPNGNRYHGQVAKDLTEAVMTLDMSEALHEISTVSGLKVEDIAACGALHAATMLVRQCLMEQGLKDKGQGLQGEAREKSELFKGLCAQRYRQLWQYTDFEPVGRSRGPLAPVMG
jgi:hypothetical protein